LKVEKHGLMTVLFYAKKFKKSVDLMRYRTYNKIRKCDNALNKKRRK